MKVLKKVILAAAAAILCLTGFTSAVSASAGNPAAVSAGGFYKFGTADIYSTQWPGETWRDSYYYTDEWFRADPAEQNDALALISMQLTAASVTGKTRGAGCTFLKGLGFKKVGVSKHFNSPDPDDCCFIWGKKTIGEGKNACTLVAVVIQSYALDQATKQKGWVQNFTVNGKTAEGEHAAFALAADKVISEICRLGGSGPVKYWIMGHSRGGALTNILAKRLPEKKKNTKGGIYAYTFEAPATVDKASAGSEKQYGYIHNYRCSDDVVTMIPPWGMTRYGVYHALKTRKTDRKLPAELKKLGLDEDQLLVMTVDESSRSMAKQIVRTLKQQIPARKTYSARQKDTFADADGKKITVSYTYQDKLCGLMSVLFGGGLEGVDASKLLERLEELYPAVKALAAGVKNHSDSDFWQAAVIFRTILSDAAPGLDLTEEDWYVLFKLCGPLLVDADYEPAGDFAEDTIMYLTPLIELVGKKDSLLLSHQFETVVARLKTLAPAPELGDIELTVREPEAGDSVFVMPREIKKAFRGLGLPCAAVSSAWLKKNGEISAHQTSYLQVILRVTGRRIPKKFMFRINGKKPVRGLEITREKGKEVIRGIWAFRIGKQSKVTVTYDAGWLTDSPEPEKVNAGSRLEYVLHPKDLGIVSGNGRNWQFNGWYAIGDVPYTELTADKDIKLYAGWTELIDRMEFTFKIPEVGQKFKAPAVKAGGGYYVLDNWYVRDENWETVRKAESTKKLYLSFTVVVDPTQSDLDFWSEKDEYGEWKYLGKALVNGRKAEVTQDEKEVRIEYAFRPTASSEKGGGKKAEESVPPGASAEEADRVIRSLAAEEDPEGSGYLPLQLRSGKQRENSIRLQWEKPSGADTFVVYGAECGTGNRMKRLKTLRKNSCMVSEAGKKLSKGRYYKFMVVALNRKQKVVSASTIIYAAAGGSKKSGNDSDLQICVRKNGKRKKAEQITLKSGEKVRLEVTAVRKSKNIRVRKHAEIRYASSNGSVAAVTPDGVIHAGKKGNCRVYAYAQNGVYRSVRVHIK